MFQGATFLKRASRLATNNSAVITGSAVAAVGAVAVAVAAASNNNKNDGNGIHDKRNVVRNNVGVAMCEKNDSVMGMLGDIQSKVCNNTN